MRKNSKMNKLLHKKKICFIIMVLSLLFNYNIVFSENSIYDFNDIEVWDGSIAESFSYGEGTSNNPYKISTASEFALFAKNINDNIDEYNSAFYCLDTDIDLNNIDWTPIGNNELSYSIDEHKIFKGTFDGQGHTIKNLKISYATTNYLGLFGVTSNAKIYGLGIKNCDISVITSNSFQLYCGSLVGLSQETEIYDCYSDGEIQIYCSSSACIGGISGSQSGHMAYSGANINLNVGVLDNNELYMGYCGGLIGYSSADVNNSYATGDVSVNMHSMDAGGLIGFSSADVNNSYATGDISGKCIYNKYGNISTIGGLIGRIYNKNSVNYCYAIGNVENQNTYGNTYAGGLVGRQVRERLSYRYIIANSFAEGNVISNGDILSNSFAGALIGDIEENLTDISAIWLFNNCYFNSMSDIVRNNYYSSNNNVGTAIDKTNFQSEQWIEHNIKFDIEDIWEIKNSYPCLYEKNINLFKAYNINNTFVSGNNVVVNLTKILNDSGVSIIALYDINGLLKVDFKNINMQINDTNDVFFDINYDNISAVSIFLWDSINSMTPTTKKIDISI